MSVLAKHTILQLRVPCVDMFASFPIIWLTGNSGAGKTTLASAARAYFHEFENASPMHRRVIVLDGDEMRASISTEESLTPEDRRRHNLRVARLAKVLQAQDFLVLVAVIAPFQSVRDEIDRICSPRWIYIERSHLGAPNRPYEPPLRPDAVICTDTGSVGEHVAEFIELIKLFVQRNNLRERQKVNVAPQKYSTDCPLPTP